MVIIWLMMVNNNLVGGFHPTPLKNHGGNVNWDYVFFPTEWKVIKFHGSSHHQAVMVYQNTVPAFLVGVQWGTFVVAIAISMTNEDCDIL